MRIFLSNLGCKLNQAETDEMTRSFRSAGHEIVTSLTEADVHVVNSCTVTHLAARDSRKLARRGARVSPALRTVLTGCYVASDPDASSGIEGVDLVVPNSEKDNLVERLHEAFPEFAPDPVEAGDSDIPCAPSYLATCGERQTVPDFQHGSPGHRRALVKIEDGCNMRCSFCIIPFTRGRQHSRAPERIVQDVRDLEATGYKEVVVTGVQISSYRSQEHGLFELTRELLDRTEVARLRLSSIAPWEFDPRLLDLLDSGRICDHFHLSLQSGSDGTLQRMRRPYSKATFADLVRSIRERSPSAAITTDLIVGFPGETEEEFEESLAFTRQVEFAKIHTFPYSAREGTLAAQLPGQVGFDVKRLRMQRALELARDSQLRFWNSQVGLEAEALWEQRRNGHWVGTTSNYIRVLFPSNRPIVNDLDAVRLADPLDEGVLCARLEWNRDRSNPQEPVGSPLPSHAVT